MRVIRLSAVFIVGISVWAMGCTIEPMPIKTPSPRAFMIAPLLEVCLRSVQEHAVTLEEPGAEPRSELRYVPRRELEAGLKFLPAWTWNGDSQRKGDASRYQVDITWASIGKQGQHCFELVMRGAQEAEMDEDHPIMGVIRIGAHGHYSVQTDALDDESYDAGGELFWRMGLVQPRLPREAVGVGARWRYQHEGELRGELIEIDVQYELVTAKGSHVVLGFERAAHRPPQTVKDREGKSVRVGERTERHSGVIDVDLRDRPFPAVRLFDEAGGETERILTAYR